MRLKQRIEEVICWKKGNSLWRNGLAMHYQVAKQPEKGKVLAETDVEMETRLASGLRAFEIQGLSVVPEMGIALILDSIPLPIKPPNYRGC